MSVVNDFINVRPTLILKMIFQQVISSIVFLFYAPLNVNLKNMQLQFCAKTKRFSILCKNLIFTLLYSIKINQDNKCYYEHILFSSSTKVIKIYYQYLYNCNVIRRLLLGTFNNYYYLFETFSNIVILILSRTKTNIFS